MSRVSMVDGHDDDVRGDLISRSALIAYFKEQCEEAAKGTDQEDLYTLAALKCCTDYFRTIPAVDAVPVVRCKDCKGFNADDKFCIAWEAFVRADDFCSYGERRDGE